jgi:hypothetical protein
VARKRPKILFQRVGDFADGGAQAHRLDRQVEQVAFAGFGAAVSASSAA